MDLIGRYKLMQTNLFSVAAIVVMACLAGCGGSSGDPPPATPPPPPPPAPDLSGLDARPANMSCVAPARPTGSADVAIERHFAALGFSQPLGMLQRPGDDSRWFVLEKTGRVRVFDASPDTTGFQPDFINLAAVTNLNTSSEGGLLGMAFHPDYTSNGQVFLSFTEGSSPMTSVVARFDTVGGGLAIDAGSREDLIRLEQDFSNHNGGHIVFGPEGYLYVGFGDGGSGGDPLSRAQETRNLLGAMLRIDVDGPAPYGIPSDNGFFGNATCPADPDVLSDDCPEIFAWGLRNPWRFSFDAATGDLWAGDVGQSAFEEINLIERNGNYGWDCREGFGGFGSPAAGCATASGLIDPVHVYPRSEGVSITGGFVYRGSEIPALIGSYLFADYGSGRLWRLVDDGAGGFTDELLLNTGISVAAFGQSLDNEIYLVDIAGGALHRLVAGSGSGASSVPDRLSATGCMSSSDASQPGDALIPYAPVAPFWSDGADKQRWFAIPDGTTIDVDADGDFGFPPGSVLVKQFLVSGELIETRLLMRHPDGVWAGYSYAWDEALDDGVLVTGGSVVDIGAQDWIFPSSAQCNQCHTAAAGRSLGLETAQLNHDLTYAAAGRTANQLSTLDSVLLLTDPLGDPGGLSVLADPADSAATLDARARAYLHSNCSHCHRPAGPAPTALDLRATTPLSMTGACDQSPQNGDLGLGAAARIIAPGSAANSVLTERVGRRDAAGMPPLASFQVDTEGVALLSDWIDSLSSCL